MSENDKGHPSVIPTTPVAKTISTKEEMGNFATDIAKLMTQLKITAMEAIIHYSQKNGIEIEVLAKLVNKDVKEVLKEEAASLNFLRYKNGKVIRPKKNKKKKEELLENLSSGGSKRKSSRRKR
jgi:hypothetical protein